jgi:hypothetical protein
MSYHNGGPCVTKKWWAGKLTVGLDEKLFVPEILAHESEAKAAQERIQQLRDVVSGRQSIAATYASGLTVAAIMQEERHVLEAHLLLMHTRLSIHLQQLSDEQVDKAVADLQAYVNDISLFLRQRTADKCRMKILKRRFQQKPRRFVDLVRQLKEAVSAF